MKALITGGAGFIGSHLAQALCARGAEVCVLDNLSLGSRENLDWKKPGDQLDFIEGDAGDADDAGEQTHGSSYRWERAFL